MSDQVKIEIIEKDSEYYYQVSTMHGDLKTATAPRKFDPELQEMIKEDIERVKKQHLKSGL